LCGLTVKVATVSYESAVKTTLGAFGVRRNRW